ncbi:isocitrate lyase/phosphoenolpyruvate mutase family protein [Roseococcus sp. SYP-B2431]|uniref:isocitrate lyase/PEP mutase family protein n=1 Tax=Roseococcus sp. SYP-B2431 TaxID=2496640 RepID=UPI00103F9728|nr:isocitrate lyase/phosphoenolpyruvate mutase family protein [Roseococcus sp. SYP-B2431]TCH97471.1 isocitrate lyase/phosphoenolpyruvate mutase family protein [Roseococcus sp. SYP-B2431]
MSAAYETFRDLHQKGCFVMPNPWDGASAVLLAREGFAALGSTSLGIAFALGVPDGRALLSREVSIENAAMIHRLTGLPVNGDLEDGFGPSPEDCVRTVEASIAAGLAGLGIEDTTANPADPIHGFDAAVARVKAAAKAARGRIVLTGRTDNFLNGRPDLDDTIRRLQAFAEVGADVLYAPGLPDMAAIEAVVKAVAPKPVNVVFGPRSGPVPLAVLAAAGVRRVSLGGSLYRQAMGAMVGAARRLRAGDFDIMGGAPTSAEVTELLPTRG